MSEKQYLQDYLSYIANNPDIKPLKHFVALGAMAESPPALFNTLPIGDVFVYPRFVVFLTLDQSPAGAGLIFDKIVKELEPLFKLREWATSPETIILDAAKWLSKKYQKEDTLAKALANPNSILVPVDSINSVDAGKYLSQGNYIRIRTIDRVIVICQSMNHENAFSAMASWLTGNWQADTIAMLRGNSGSAPASGAPKNA
ncbi:hypothetical protein [Candidatus Thiodictyon syntrophicum]|jgi:hypothetical protein|uniref:hypothetical protein n=1 Tax=Candidatus Thiodictyon syntrophicum TaxID=1166950 RepID=UPI0012FD8283|nr:hypothetical protein [Candidatus Thiodictyon syntrophicum]